MSPKMSHFVSTGSAVGKLADFARPLSLTVRLYANMFAGETVFTTFLSLTKVIIPVIFLGLHLFVSLLQAYIFMLLAMVSMSPVTSPWEAELPPTNGMVV